MFCKKKENMPRNIDQFVIKSSPNITLNKNKNQLKDLDIHPHCPKDAFKYVRRTLNMLTYLTWSNPQYQKLSAVFLMLNFLL